MCSQVTGLSYDQLLLYSILPVVHSCLLNLLITLIQTCHTHLLPYTTLIESCIVQALTSDPSRLVLKYESLTHGTLFLSEPLQEEQEVSCYTHKAMQHTCYTHTHTHSEALTPSVHQCLSTWVSMRKDTDNHFITRTTSALIKTADSSGNGINL